MNESESLKNEEELISLERMQTELEEKDRIIADLKRQLPTSEYYSEVSNMKKMLLEQAEEIKSLHEQIGTMNDADLILQENEKLKEENSRLVRETETVVKQAQKDFNDKERKLYEQAIQVNEAHEKLQKSQAELDEKMTNENEHIKKEAKTMSEKTRKHYQKLYQEKCQKLNNDYNAKTTAHAAIYTGTILYSIGITLLTMISSGTFVEDFGDFFITVGRIIYNSIEWSSEQCDSFAALSMSISQPAIQKIVYFLLYLILAVIQLGIIVALLYFVIDKFVEWYRNEIADYISLFVAFITLAVSTTLDEYVKILMPMNLVAFNILIHLMYCWIRRYVREKKKNGGYYY